MNEQTRTLAQALGWLNDGHKVAVATVVDTWGSSPCPAGSLLAIRDDGRFEGSVSGGCIEGSVVSEALAVLDEGRPRLVEYGIPDDRAWEVGLACGGRLSVFVEAAAEPAMVRALVDNPPLALVTDLDSGRHALVDAAGVSGDLTLAPEMVEDARAALAQDRSLRLGANDRNLFATVFSHRSRMIIVGAVHIAQALAPMAALAGFAVTVVDPRLSFASPERFAGFTLSHEWPDEALAAIGVDGQTAVVTLSHDPKLDDPALQAALRSPAFYVGALGSRKTQASRRERLRGLGFGDDDLARIHGPIGLDLGGRRAGEIAVAILAQIIAARYGKAPEGLRSQM
ncbi:MAG: XdhC family protein [Rhodospirillales bacterium]|nr:XdhC family protein [Rhodospirillales bacterium]